MAITTKNRSKHQSTLTKKTTAISLVALLIVISIPVLLYQQQDNFSGALVGAINPNPFHTDNNAKELRSFPLTGKAVENAVFVEKKIPIRAVLIQENSSNRTIKAPTDIILGSFTGNIRSNGDTFTLEGNIKNIDLID